MTGESIPGRLHQYDHPEWAPLVTLVGDDVADEFMWMCELALADGARVEAYKHRATRRYLYLAGDGRALARTAVDAYMAIEPEDAIRRAIHAPEKGEARFMIGPPGRPAATAGARLSRPVQRRYWGDGPSPPPPQRGDRPGAPKSALADSFGGGRVPNRPS